tara:strand:- start:1142 stop:1342 length:201 start_codon:yes stop_codon:yes gene_type:complete
MYAARKGLRTGVVRHVVEDHEAMHVEGRLHRQCVSERRKLPGTRVLCTAIYTTTNVAAESSTEPTT